MAQTDLITLQKKSTKLIDQIRFVGAVIRSPHRLGAITPTSAVVSDVIASHISSDRTLPVLELGPGTGPVTEAILRKGVPEEQIYAVEYDQKFCEDWAKRYTRAQIVQGNALDLNEALAQLGDMKFDCVVSGIPMLNFSADEHAKFLESAFSRIPAGHPIIQITYGKRSPIIVDDPLVQIEQSARILRNVPPAKVWAYRRKK